MRFTGLLFCLFQQSQPVTKKQGMHWSQVLGFFLFPYCLYQKTSEIRITTDCWGRLSSAWGSAVHPFFCFSNPDHQEQGMHLFQFGFFLTSSLLGSTENLGPLRASFWSKSPYQSLRPECCETGRLRCLEVNNYGLFLTVPSISHPLLLAVNRFITIMTQAALCYLRQDWYPLRVVNDGLFHLATSEILLFCSILDSCDVLVTSVFLIQFIWKSKLLLRSYDCYYH